MLIVECLLDLAIGLISDLTFSRVEDNIQCLPWVKRLHSHLENKNERIWARLVTLR